MRKIKRTIIPDWMVVALSAAFVFVVVGASSKNNRPHVPSQPRTIGSVEITATVETRTQVEDSPGNSTIALKKKVTKPKKKRPNGKTSGSNSDKRSYSSGSTTSTSLRRIKREYKDAVDMGIAYDWAKQRLVTRKSKTKRAPSVDGDADGRIPSIMCLGPITTNLRQWHFSFRGAGDGAYSKGIYHGQILLPKDYPMSPPSVQMWTPSGRFVPGRDICLSASNYHPESWTPKWSIQGIVNALRLHMLTAPNEIGGMQSTHDEEVEFARLSLAWKQRWRDGGSIITVDHRLLLEEGILSDGSSEEPTNIGELLQDLRGETGEREESEDDESEDNESEGPAEVATEQADHATTEDGLCEYGKESDNRIRFGARFSLSMSTVTSLVQLACLYVIVLLFFNR